jgi:hypothetical protein
MLPIKQLASNLLLPSIAFKHNVTQELSTVFGAEMLLSSQMRYSVTDKWSDDGILFIFDGFKVGSRKVI